MTLGSRWKLLPADTLALLAGRCSLGLGEQLQSLFPLASHQQTLCSGLGGQALFLDVFRRWVSRYLPTRKPANTLLPFFCHWLSAGSTGPRG